MSQRLKVLSVLLPVAFILLLELFRYGLESSNRWTNELFSMWRVTIVVFVVAAIIVFAMVMFRYIDAAQRQLLRQNRDLTVAHAVASAIQGATDVEAIVESTVEAILSASAASRVRVRLYAPGATEEDQDSLAKETDRRLEDGIPDDAPPSLDVPLTNGPSTVGRLSVWYPMYLDVDDRIGASTLAGVSAEVARSLQLATAVESLNRGKEEGHAFYDILVRLSNEDDAVATVERVAGYARGLLRADAAAVAIGEDTARFIRFDSGEGAPAVCADGATVVSVGLPQTVDPRTGEAVNPLTAPPWPSSLTWEVKGPAGRLGDLWVGRQSGASFDERDRAFLENMASLIGIALTGAQMRESARQRVILNERTRIAREMHDGLAQVLGVVHLRLRALEASPDVRPRKNVATEVGALADICEEAYRDVREAILGLRESNQPERSLEVQLSSYLSRYSQQSGVEARLVNEVGHDIALTPRAEVHLIRLVQEALTNVRKHSGAKRAIVRISGTDATTSFGVEDDGVGFDPSVSSGDGDGYGLFTMRERMALLHGTLEVDSAPGQGTRIVATVPQRPYVGRREPATT